MRILDRYFRGCLPDVRLQEPMKRPCALCIDGMVWMRTDLSNPDCDTEDWTTCPRCGGTRFVEMEEE